MHCFKREAYVGFGSETAAWFLFIASLFPRARNGIRWERDRCLCDSEKGRIIIIRYPYLRHVTAIVDPVNRKCGLPINVGLSNTSQL